MNIDWSIGSDFRELYETLSSLRRDHPALHHGKYIPIQNSHSVRVYSFLRTEGKDTVLVVINFDTTSIKVNLTVPPNLANSWKDYFSKRVFQSSTGSLDLTLSRLGFAVLIPESKAK
jgi:glycosidase